jgi:4-amino-4-deoxy-L-arabinose transferase-like glycosyltransferase
MKKFMQMKQSSTGGDIPLPSGPPPGILSLLLRSHAMLPALLSFAILLGFFYNLHSIPLFDVDEGAFSEATREMLAGGDYVTTYLNGDLRFDKPILVYWLQAVSVSLFGMNEFAFRLPSALASVGWIGAILLFARQQTDRATGFVAALIAATTVGVLVIGRAATADALLNLFLALTMFDIYRYMEYPQRKTLRRIYLWMGLGLLTKGPIAVLIPFAVSGVVFFLEEKLRLWRDAVIDPVGWAILLGVAGPWYLLEYQRQGNAFIAGFFTRHNIERFQSPLQGHGGSVLYYVPAALLLLLPYSGLFLRILPSARNMGRRSLTRFLWTWFLFVLVFFSIARTKLPHYLLYGVTPIFILMAMHREQLRSRWLAFLPPFILLSLVLAFPALLQFGGARVSDPYFREMLTRHGLFGAPYYLAASALLLATVILAFLPRIAVWCRLVAMGLLCSAALGALILPTLGELQQGPVKEAASIAKKVGAPVTAWGINMPSFSVYLDNIPRRDGLPDSGELVFTRIDKLKELGPAEVVYRKGGIVLVRRHSSE